MTPRIFHDDDAPPDALRDATVAVIGYGNQGSAWAKNLRDSGLDVIVGTISDDSRARAADDGFPAHEVADAAREARVVCALIPDEVMRAAIDEHIGPNLQDGDVLCVASGYVPTFEDPAIPEGVDLILIAPRMLGAGVRDAYLEGAGFITFVSAERDASGHAHARMLCLAHALGGTRRGAIELDARSEAVLDLFIEQGISAALAKVWSDGALALLEAGIPLEAILVEYYLSGEIEFAYRSLRTIGYEAQSRLHSETSQYGSLSRARRFADLDTLERMRAIIGDISSGSFASEWTAEREAGYPVLDELRANDPRAALTGFEQELRARLS